MRKRERDESPSSELVSRPGPETSETLHEPYNNLRCSVCLERVTRRDLLPDNLNLNALRLASVVPLSYVFTTIAKPDAAPFVALDIVTQALAWLYLEDRLNML